jgi:uncharacterized protein YqjF (DUF2071 family)
MESMTLDRIGPTRREACTTRQTGVQTWRDLLFLHWSVDPAALRGLIPPELTIDTFDGRAYVGLVPFTMDHVRFGPMPLRPFLETNVRTYVHADGVPGVWFLSLEAESRLAVHGARVFFRLPYFFARMKCGVSGDSVEYWSDRVGASREARVDVRWTVLDAGAHHAAPESLEHFLTERYALYGPRRDGSVYRVRVHHPPWPLHRARADRLSESLLAAAGVAVSGDPIDLVLASPRGVDVKTFAEDSR